MGCSAVSFILLTRAGKLTMVCSDIGKQLSQVFLRYFPTRNNRRCVEVTGMLLVRKEAWVAAVILLVVKMEKRGEPY